MNQARTKHVSFCNQRSSFSWLVLSVLEQVKGNEIRVRRVGCDWMITRAGLELIVNNVNSHRQCSHSLKPLVEIIINVRE